jgi:ABC-type transport system involved in multi-copper enzyme maturation permease subunit
MNVFLTLLLDSLRLLRARVLFWITLVISALVAVIYLSIGFNPEGISLLFGALDIKSEMFNTGSGLAEVLYLGIFSDVLVGFWLSWVAVILAIISCAPIFPDFMSEGSIGIPLSKPVSRLTLFIYKYISSLMFVVLQVAIFCVIVFLAIRWRVGSWNPSVFWAVPIVTLMFSYIYSVVVLVSVKTRSVLAAILAGIFVWFLAWGMQKSDDFLYVASHPEAIANVTGMQSAVGTFGSPEEMMKWHKISSMAIFAMPKTGETTRLMDRLIKVNGHDGESDKSLVTAATKGENEASGSLKKAITRNSTGYVIGTSLLFEALMLGWAASIFCRRDY